MKYYNMKVANILNTPDSEGMESFNVQSHYAVPYERNDEYLKLINQENPRNPESLLEPESGKLLYADVDFEYNYYAPSFEEFTVSAVSLIMSSDTHESTKIRHIPSLNLHLLSGSSLAESNPVIQDLYHANTSLYVPRQAPPEGMTPHGYGSWITSNPEIPPQAFLERHILSLQFFESIAGSYDHLVSWGYASQLMGSQHLSILADKQTFLSDMPGFDKPEFINLDMARIYADVENKREMYPFFAKFMLTGVQKNGFCDLLENTGLVEEFIDYLIMHRPDGRHTDITYTNNVLQADGSYSQTDFNGELYLYTINMFLEHLNNHGINNSFTYPPSSTTCSFFESWINSQLFTSTLDEWISNAPINQSMPVAFRLEKHSAEGGQISTHYFFNYSDLLEFKYYDSMVAFRHGFVYKLRVINLYVHSVGETSTQRTLLFMEEPYYMENIFILDSPPIAPDVEILTYRGVADRNLILLNQMIDKEALVPIEINPSDIENFDRQYSAQKIQRPNPIIFESDSPSDFEIFKLMEKPTSYSDFATAEYKFLRTDNANSISYEDNIVPNQYYYYIFRAQDPHGYPSNPTPVYEFILIKEGETMYPRIRIVDFKKPDPPTQKSKSFKKYVKIGFSPRQYTTSYNADFADPQHPSYDPLFDPTDADIGISEDNIIGSNRVFKFRIRSKNTGKLVDINVTFKKNKLIHE